MKYLVQSTPLCLQQNTVGLCIQKNCITYEKDFHFACFIGKPIKGTG